MSPCSLASFGEMEGEFDEDELNPAIDLEQRRAIAESVVGQVDWFEDRHGHCACPGEDQHTSPTRPEHCRIHLSGVPTIHCFHSSCEAAVSAKNCELRSKLPASDNDEPVCDNKPRRRSRRLRNIEAKAESALETILSEYAWLDEGIASSIASVSPILLPHDPVEQTKLFLRTVFDPNDVVWIGQKKHSGQPRHQRHFRTTEQWLRERSYLGEFTCANSFESGCHSRSEANIALRQYVVVESDKLSFGQTAGVFQFLETLPGWKLRAVVYSGKTSLHGWFSGAPVTWPADELAAFIRGLRCDPATLRSSQPVRLPGALRAETGIFQALLYLAAAATH